MHGRILPLYIQIKGCRHTGNGSGHGIHIGGNRQILCSRPRLRILTKGQLMRLPEVAGIEPGPRRADAIRPLLSFALLIESRYKIGKKAAVLPDHAIPAKHHLCLCFFCRCYHSLDAVLGEPVIPVHKAKIDSRCHGDAGIPGCRHTLILLGQQMQLCIFTRQCLDLLSRFIRAAVIHHYDLDILISLG